MLKLEDGKTYVTRDGVVVGPLWSNVEDSEFGEGKVYFSEQSIEGYLTVWLEDGRADFFGYFESDPKWDIVKEFVENS